MELRDALVLSTSSIGMNLFAVCDGSRLGRLLTTELDDPDYQLCTLVF